MCGESAQRISEYFDASEAYNGNNRELMRIWCEIRLSDCVSRFCFGFYLIRYATWYFLAIVKRSYLCDV